MQRFSLPVDHVLLSRPDGSIEQVTQATKGRRFDVILNTLEDGMLGSTWPTIGDDGIMIDVRRRHAQEQLQISVEPFSRNASFKTLDIGHSSITDKVISRWVSVV
jgi:hypothetical protein